MVEASPPNGPRSRGLALVSAVALIVTLVIVAPVLRAPSERLFGTEVVGRHHDPFTVMQQFAGAPVPPPYLQPATDLIGRALAHVVSPVIAYNLLLLWTFPLAAAAAYLFAYELTRRAATSTVAGLLFAFAPFHLAHAAYHVHVSQVQWIPLCFLALWRSLHGTTFGRAATLVAALGLVVLSNFYGGFIALTLTPVAILSFWLAPSPNGRSRSWRDLAWTSAIVVAFCAGAVLTAGSVAPTIFEHREALAFPRADLFRYSARWWSYLLPPVTHPLLGAWSRSLWEAFGIGPGLLEQQVSLGIGVVTLAAVALLAWARSPDRTIHAAVPFLTAVAAAALICSLSPERHIFGVRIVRPAALLYLVAPMFRSYARFGVVVQLMVAIVASTGLTWLWQRRTRAARAAALALAVLTAVEYTPLPWQWRDVLPTSAHRWVARHQSAPRVFDCTTSAPAEQATAWLAGYALGHLRPAVPDCGVPDLARALGALGFTEVLVRAGRPEFRWLADHPREGLRSAYVAADAAVFDVEVPRSAAYVASVECRYPREYGRTWTWRWTSGDATLHIENPGAASQTAFLDLELASFGVERHLAVSLDGNRVADLVVGSSRAVYRVGPLMLPPGSSRLAMRSIEAPVVAATLERGGDARPLAIAVGQWRWRQP